MLHDDLFVGEAVGSFDRTGTISVSSVAHPGIRCIGSFRYTGSKVGTARVQCNDGAEASFDFNGLSSLSGYGIGRSTRGPASFTFGLTPEQAQPYLTLPIKTKLERGPAGVRLMPT